MLLGMPRTSVCGLLLCLVCSGPVAALDPLNGLTQYSASVWTQQQGLPQDTIRAIAQTSDGFLWLGTDGGLVRFDGYDFVSFSREQGAAVASAISALAAGTDGSLWIGSRGGLTHYKNGHFRTYTRKDGLVDNLVSSIFVDHAGIVWIVAGGSLSRFDGTHFLNFLRERDVSSSIIRGVTETRDHELYICGNSAVERLVNGHFVTVIGPSILSSDFPAQILADGAGNLWIAGARALIERRPDNTLTRYGQKEGLSDAFGVLTIAEGRGGAIWAGTPSGLAGLEGSLFHNLPESRDSGAVNSIFEDREGNLWVGSDIGLTRYRDDLFTFLGKPEGLPDNGPSTLFQDHAGNLWAGYNDELVMLKQSQLPAIPLLSARLFVHHIRETGSGELLVSSVQGLIYLKGENKRTFASPDPQGRKTVFDAVEGSNGMVWLALPNGLGQLDHGHLRIVIPAGPLFRDDSFYVLAIASDGAIWAGTLSNGLWRYKNGEKQLYTAATGLSSGQIRSLYADPSGALWIGTQDGGLNVFRDGKFIQYRARDGLLSDNINAITDDGESLWLSTTRGICRISRQQLADFAERRIQHLLPLNYGVDDGMRSAHTSDGLRLNNGELWFGTSRGIAIYDRRADSVASFPPLIHILDLSTDRRSFGINHPDLPPGSGRVQIRYTGIYLRAPDRVRYSYMLDGSDSDWANADESRTVNYDSLSHGKYRFRVKAELPGGIFNESSIDFTVEPHYYETAWFRAVGVLLLITMIFAGYKFRERQVRSRFALVLEERAHLAREVHDTIAQGYVGIASQLDVVEMTMPPNADAARSGLEFARRMVRHSLTEARRSLMDLRASASENQNLAAALQAGADRWTANSHAQVKVRISGDDSSLPEEVAHHVFRIGQEAIVNAVKHAAPNHIEMELKIGPQQLLLRVADDGSGFEPDDAFTSKRGNFGLIGMRERAERIKGELRLDSRPGKGTRLDITVPL